MKRTKILLAGALLGLSVASFSAITAINLNKPVGTDAAYSKSTPTTSIDLNDPSTSTIRNYYSSLNGLGQSERQGTNLLKNLKTILKNGQKYYKYDSDNGLWQIYEISDRDWSKSPASSISGYNSSTNKITNYSYGEKTSEPGSNPYLHALYVKRSVTNKMKAWQTEDGVANHGGNAEWAIDREHIWPKAEGFDDTTGAGARGDPMHLWPGDSGVNSALHSNYYYGYVNTSSSYTHGYDWDYTIDNLMGKSLTLGGSTNVFEPQDCDKGDIARAVFYMVARYNYLSGSDSDGITSDNPNLELTQSLSDWASSGYSSTTSSTGKMGILTDLLDWNRNDPPDEWEIHRNNLLYVNYTNNRNPFIDFPEWAEYIWGKATYNSSHVKQSYSSTPTGYATPSSDTMNNFSGGSTPTVTLSLNPSSLSFTTDDLTAKTVTVTASGGSGSVSVSNSDSTVCTVTNSGNTYTVTPKKVGTATLTFSYSGETATCSVTVVDSSIATSDGSVTAASGALSGWTASGTGNAYADGSVKLDSSGDNVYCSTLFTSPVSTNMTSLSVTINGKINGTPTDTNSYKVEAIDSSGNVLNSQTLTGSSIYTGSYGDATFTMSGNLTGCTGIKITYVTKGGGNWGVMSVSWTATYSEGSGGENPTLSSISVLHSPTKTSYTAGEYFNPAGLVLTLTYSDESNETATYSNETASSFTFSPSTSVQLATTHTKVTISYGGLSCDQSITVTSGGGGGSTPAGTFTVNLKDNSLSSATSYQFSQTTANYNGGDATASLYWGGLNAKVGNVKGNGDTMDNLQSGTSSNNFYIHNTSALPGVVTSITLSGISGTTTASKAYALVSGSVISTQAKASSTAGTAGTNSVTWTFNESTSGTFFAIGCEKGFTSGTVTAESFIIQYAASSTSGTVSLNKESTTIAMGSSDTLAATTGGSGTLTWASADSSIATVSSGVITPVAPGTTTITASYGGATAVCTVRITDTNTIGTYSLKNSSPYINGLAYKMYFNNTTDGNTYYFAGGMDGNFGTTDTTLNNGVNVYFEEATGGQNIFFIDSDSVKQYFYVNYAGSNYRFAYSPSAPSASWVYSVSGEDYACMTYTANSNPCTFGTYSNKTTFGAINLNQYTTNYEVDFISCDTNSAEAYGKVFLDSLTCDSTGNSKPTFNNSVTWSQLSTAYSKLGSSYQTTIKNTSGNESSSSNIARAMHYYDYILGKYPSDGYTNFINRSISSLSRPGISIFGNVSSSSSTAIIILIAVIGVTSLGLVITLRKRKEN